MSDRSLALTAEVDAALRSALAALRASPHVRYGEVRFVEQTTEHLKVRDGRPETMASGSSRGVGIRVLGSRTWGFASTAHLDEASLVRCARHAVDVAEASSRIAQRAINLEPLPPQVGHYATPLAVDPFAVALEDKLADLDGPVRAILAKGKPVTGAEGWMDWWRVHKRLLTTEDTDVTQTLTYGSCGIHALCTGDDGRPQRRSYPTWSGGEGFQGGYEQIAALDLAGNVDRIVAEATALVDAPECPAGDRDVILESSQVALQIHESCGHPTELDRALGTEISLAGGSFLQPDMLGSFRYGSPLVTLTADATAKGGFGTFGWDDEGVPAGKHVLVREGLFEEYLSSREMAAAIGRRSTGTMRAESWNRTPLIRMVNVSLEPRAGSLEDLVADTADGVLIATDRSWSIDDLRLNFQFSCEIAWEIKRGKRTRILKNPLYTGITPRFWAACDAVCGPEESRLWGIATCGKGDPMQLIHVGHGAPPARFRGVTVGSAGGAS